MRVSSERGREGYRSWRLVKTDENASEERSAREMVGNGENAETTTLVVMVVGQAARVSNLPKMAYFGTATERRQL